MNERIKELMEQADLQPYYNAQEAAIKKFAEMIVQECASICEINGQSYKYSFTPAKAQLAESTSNHCGIMIKKHFGVEK